MVPIAMQFSLCSCPGSPPGGNGIVIPDSAIISKICLSSGSAQFIAVRSVENKSHPQILYISHHSNKHNFALLLVKNN